MPQRGEIYWVDFSPGRGSEPMGVRPALIIQSDGGNVSPNVRTTIVATISHSGREELPFYVRVEPNSENGLDAVSYIKCEALYTLDKSRLEDQYLGKISASELEKVEHALQFSLALPRA